MALPHDTGRRGWWLLVGQDGPSAVWHDVTIQFGDRGQMVTPCHYRRPATPVPVPAPPLSLDPWFRGAGPRPRPTPPTAAWQRPPDGSLDEGLGEGEGGGGREGCSMPVIGPSLYATVEDRGRGRYGQSVICCSIDVPSNDKRAKCMLVWHWQSCCGTGHTCLTAFSTHDMYVGTTCVLYKCSYIRIADKGQSPISHNVFCMYVCIIVYIQNILIGDIP